MPSKLPRMARCIRCRRPIALAWCRICDGEAKHHTDSPVSRMGARRRALWVAKRLRARLGLSQDLFCHPWYTLERPERLSEPEWARTLGKLERHELVVWRDLARVVEHAGRIR